MQSELKPECTEEFKAGETYRHVQRGHKLIAVRDDGPRHVICRFDGDKKEMSIPKWALESIKQQGAK